MEALASLGQRAASKMSTAVDRAVETAGNRFRVHTGAMDIIVVMSADGSLQTTDWQFQVGRDASVPVGSEAEVRVFINDKLQGALAMQVGPDGACYFPETAPDDPSAVDDLLAHHIKVRARERTREAGSTTSWDGDRRLRPDAATLAKLDLELGRNEVRYEVMGQTSLMQTTVSLFLWTSEDPVVVFHVETAVMKRAAVLAKGTQALSFGRHSGQSLGWEAPWPYACELMVYMDTAGYRLVLLTSTPITWCDKVRQRLSAIRGQSGRRDDDDDELRLPAAALLSSAQRSFSHAVNSLVAEAGSFQSEALSQVLAAFGQIGPSGIPRRLGAADDDSGNQPEKGNQKGKGKKQEETNERDADARAAVPRVAAIGAFGAAAVLHSLTPSGFSLRRRAHRGGVGMGENLSAPERNQGGEEEDGRDDKCRGKRLGRRRERGGLVGAFGDGKIDPSVFKAAGIEGEDIFCISDKGVVSSHDSSHGPFDTYKAMLRHLPHLFAPVRGRCLMPAFALPADRGWGDGTGGQLEHKGMGGATYRTNAVPHGSRFNRVDESDAPEAPEEALQPARPTYVATSSKPPPKAGSGNDAAGAGGGATADGNDDDGPRDGPEDACEWAGADGYGSGDSDSSDSSDSDEEVVQPAVRRRSAPARARARARVAATAQGQPKGQCETSHIGQLTPVQGDEVAAATTARISEQDRPAERDEGRGEEGACGESGKTSQVGGTNYERQSLMGMSADGTPVSRLAAAAEQTCQRSDWGAQERAAHSESPSPAHEPAASVPRSNPHAVMSAALAGGASTAPMRKAGVLASEPRGALDRDIVNISHNILEMHDAHGEGGPAASRHKTGTCAMAAASGDSNGRVTAAPRAGDGIEVGGAAEDDEDDDWM